MQRALRLSLVGAVNSPPQTGRRTAAVPAASVDRRPSAAAAAVSAAWRVFPGGAEQFRRSNEDRHIIQQWRRYGIISCLAAAAR